MLTRNPQNIAQPFKFHNLNPPTLSSYFKNCLKNTTYMTVTMKIATWFKHTVRALKVTTFAPSWNIYNFFNSNATYFPKINLFGLQVAALKLIHLLEFCTPFLAHWYKLHYSGSMLSEFHYLKQYVMHTNHTHFITSLVLHPITFFRTLFSRTSHFMLCHTVYKPCLCRNHTEQKYLWHKETKQVKWMERKESGGKCQSHIWESLQEIAYCTVQLVGADINICWELWVPK
jgi:hypothetical protein